jgi:hypothetical protein
LDFITVIFLKGKDVSLTLNPQHEDQVLCKHIPLWQGVQGIPQAESAFYDLQGIGWSIINASTQCTGIITLPVTSHVYTHMAVP